MEIHFLNLEMLLFLAIIPGLYFLYRHYELSKKNNSIKFSSLLLVKQSISEKNLIRKHLPFILICTVIFFGILGLANPSISEMTLKDGTNIVLAIDGSESMSANDYNPTRLEAAKDSSRMLITELNENENIGIILFHSGATTVSYLTPLKDKTLENLNSITHGTGSTALGDGLGLAVEMTAAMPDKKGIVILLSDGVHNSGMLSPQDAIEYAKMNDVKIITIGMGSKEPVIVGEDLFGNAQLAELDEPTLIQIAQSTGGKYYKSIDEKTLSEIFSIIAQDIQTEFEYSSIKDWFFGASIAVMITTALMIYGRYKIVV